MGRFTLIFALTMILLTVGSKHSVPEVVVPSLPPAPQVTGPTWVELSFEYQSILVNDIRIEYLMRRSGITDERASRIVAAVHSESEHYGLDANRMLALILVESFCNPNAESRVGALGLMQVMPATGRFISRTAGFKWNGTGGLRVIESNISYGTWYYHHLLVKFEGDDHAALAAYNWGPEHIRGRIRNLERLPQVYPGKVYAAEEELRGVIWNEYDLRYWRGVDQYVSDAREREHADRSEDGSSDCSLLLDDEQVVCLRDIQPVPGD